MQKIAREKEINGKFHQNNETTRQVGRVLELFLSSCLFICLQEFGFYVSSSPFDAEFLTDTNVANWIKNNANSSFVTSFIDKINTEKSISTEVLTSQEVIDVPNGTTTERIINLSLGAGEYLIQDTSLMDMEVSGSMVINSSYLKDFGVPVVETSLDDGIQTIDFYTEGEDFVSLFDWTTWDKLEYTFLIAQQETPTSFDIEMGSGSNTIDMWYQKINDFSLDQGSGNTKINLSKDSIPTEEMKFTLGSGSIEITLRDDIAYTLKYEIGSGLVTVDGARLSGVGEYKSVGYDKADNKLNIGLTMGSGSFKVEHQ